MKIAIAYFEDFVDASGGLERAICDLSNEFTRRGHALAILTYDKNDGSPYYPLSEAVELVNFNRRPRGRLPLRKKLLREIYRLGGAKICAHMET